MEDNKTQSLRDRSEANKRRLQSQDRRVRSSDEDESSVPKSTRSTQTRRSAEQSRSTQTRRGAEQSRGTQTRRGAEQSRSTQTRRGAEQSRGTQTRRGAEQSRGIQTRRSAEQSRSAQQGRSEEQPRKLQQGRSLQQDRRPQRDRRELQEDSNGVSKKIRTSGSHNIKKRTPKKKKVNRIKLVIILAVVSIVLLGIGLLGYFVYDIKYGLTDETMELSKYYEVGLDDEVAIVLDNQVIEYKGYVEGGVYYFPLEALTNYVNSRFYWDANENNLLYTLENCTIKVGVGEQSYVQGNDTVTTDYQIVKTDGQDTYIAAEFVKLLSDIQYETFEEPQRLVVTSKWGDIQVATVSKNTQVRYQGGVKSPILKEIEKGTEVEIMESGEEWTKVATDDGIMGYVKSKYCDNVTAQTIANDFEEQVYTNISEDKTINMAWHQVTNASSNNAVLETIAGTKGLTTIAPTWFFIDNVNGDIRSLASSTYVNYAHQSGIEVWAVLNDFDGGINSYDETYQVLSVTATREKIINEVIAEALKTGIDGINVDIEKVSTEAGVHFIQFVRELSVKCRQNGLVLSVDNYPPKPYNMHYDYEEQGIVADYVIIMGYDEHFSGSLEAGPVASIGYVEEGIATMVEMVAPEKVINALPFYSRLWEEIPKTEEELAAQAGTEEGEYLTKVNSKTYGMNGAVQVVADNGAEAVWDDATKQNYATWTAGESTYKIWIEDAQSVEEKLKLMKEYNLAGTSAWKLGLEDSSIWNVIEKYVN